MKRIILPLFLLLFAFGCKDACKDVSCENGGSCDDGDCTCATWYSGDECTDRVSDKFEGTYEGEKDCGPNQISSTNMSVINGDAATELRLIFGRDLEAQLVDEQSFDVPLQTFPFGSLTTTYSGSGKQTGTGFEIDLTEIVVQTIFGDTLRDTCYFHVEK